MSAFFLRSRLQFSEWTPSRRRCRDEVLCRFQKFTFTPNFTIRPNTMFAARP